MKPLIKSLVLNYPVKVFATGFVVLTLLSIPLFWFRFLCQTSLSIKMSDDAKRVSIRNDYGLFVIRMYRNVTVELKTVYTNMDQRD